MQTRKEKNEKGLAVCPHIHTINTSNYPSKTYLCESPSWGGRTFAPCVRRLRTHCLSKEAYATCVHYRKTAPEKDAGILAETLG